MTFIGFSGSREAGPQDEWISTEIVRRLGGKGHLFITGGCIGFDAQIAKAAFEAGEEVLTIVPANLSQVDPWVYTRCTRYENMPSGSTYRNRNQRIVDLADTLVAVPEDDELHNSRSGTWMTIRMGRRKGIPVEVYTLTLARKSMMEEEVC